MTVTRTQTVEVEVDSAYSDIEATWVAVQAAGAFTDAQWTTTGLRSGFHTRKPK